jgi:hypothetical protein
MKFEPLGIQWIQSFRGRSREAPHSPTMKNLPKQSPPLEFFTCFDDPVVVTLDRPSKAELGLPHKRHCRPGAQSIALSPVLLA